MSIIKLAIIQARISSSRLPGKVLMDIDAKPMLQHVVERARQAKLVDEVMVATTTDPSDDILEQFCHRQAISCFRGSLQDVLDRFYQAAKKSTAQIIVRLTADCPLLDPKLIDLTIEAFLGHNVNRNPRYPSLFRVDDTPTAFPFDFAANRLPPPWKRSLPIGLDVEVCSFTALESAWQQADKPHQREHVMPYLYDGVMFSPSNPAAGEEWYVEQGSTPSGFKVALLNHIPDYGALRWTVDTPADLEFVRQVYPHFTGEPMFGWQQVLELVRQHPELESINADVQHKSAFDVDARATSS
jgi:spore coat polysaccharide biosynthesis protein SpsF